ncbi:hypothetical protein SCOR_19355 [Sulfidibacter corallicola]
MAILIPAQPTGITSPTPVRAPRNETGSQHPNAEGFVVPGRFSRSGKPARPIYQSKPCGYLGLDRFKMYFQRAYRPCRTGGYELTGHNTPFQREGTPQNTSLRSVGLAAQPTATTPLSQMRELRALVAWKSTSGELTGPDVPTWHGIPFQREGTPQNTSLRSVGLAAQPTATTPLSQMRELRTLVAWKSTSGGLTGPDVPTWHGIPFQREGTPRIRRFEVSGWQPNLLPDASPLNAGIPK